MLANDLLAPIVAKVESSSLGSAAALAILHAKARGAHRLCITTTKLEHLQEDLTAAATPQPAGALHFSLSSTACPRTHLAASTASRPALTTH